jgi:hypothetical protein
MAKKKSAPSTGATVEEAGTKEQQLEDTPAPSDSPALVSSCEVEIITTTFHPAASIFPLLNPQEFDELVADVKANGLQVPITRFQGPGTEHRGSVLDGRNRAIACAVAGVPPIYVDRDDIVDPVAFVISANIRRRHLSSKQKRALVARLLQLDPKRSDRQIAAATGVSHHTVGGVRAEQEADGQIAQQTEVRTKDDKLRRRRGRASDKGNGSKPQHEPDAEDAVGPDSVGEHVREQSRLEKLEDENVRLKLEITGLKSQVEELEAYVEQLKAELASHERGTTEIVERSHLSPDGISEGPKTSGSPECVTKEAMAGPEISGSHECGNTEGVEESRQSGAPACGTAESLERSKTSGSPDGGSAEPLQKNAPEHERSQEMAKSKVSRTHESDHA